ncbi:MAG: type II toxin-antitoxin system HicB family antitoxin [Dehalococcoidia bacterium]|nr:type II toxin-antitoxin system HicB family antitoxin [Dehalococcoidia bacterium]
MLVKFQVYRDGRWWGARAIGPAIFTQAKTLDKLYENVKEASRLHFEEEVNKGEKPEIVLIADAEVKGGRKASVG